MIHTCRGSQSGANRRLASLEVRSSISDVIVGAWPGVRMSPSSSSRKAGTLLALTSLAIALPRSFSASTRASRSFCLASLARLLALAARQLGVDRP